MRVDLTIFKSRLAWRFFGMFVACALVPIIALAVVSYFHVTRQLEDQAYERLRQSAKSHTLSIYERLIIADHQLQIVEELSSNRLSTLNPAMSERNREIFTTIAFFRDGRLSLPWGGRIPHSCEKIIHLMEVTGEKVMLTALGNETASPAIALLRKVTGGREGDFYLVGTIDPSFLWGTGKGNLLPPGTEFVVWDEQGRSLHSTLNTPVSIDPRLKKSTDGMPRGQTEVVLGKERHYASLWSIFLKPRFHIPFWTIMVLESQRQIFAPLHYFRIIFFAVTLLSLLTTLWLSSRAIRKSLVPIDRLMDGARHVSKQDFTHRVVVESKDEFHDLAETFNRMTGDLDRQFKMNADLIRELKELNTGTLLALARTVDAKSRWTAGHSARVAQMAVDIGAVMGLSGQQIEDLEKAGLLHDIGKIGVPAVLLDKPGKLSEEEYETIKTHPSLGARILTPIKVYADLIPAVEQHHERYDGRGYPYGIAGEQIQVPARILAVADAFDAMVSDRPYRLGLPEREAIDIVDREAGHQFDPAVVEAFKRVVSCRETLLAVPEAPTDSGEMTPFLISCPDGVETTSIDRHR
jgi:putative nucleotidyltransferase with HDIG domain